MKHLALLAVPAALIAYSATAAHALPPQALPTVTCKVVIIDPAAGASVELDGFIGTHTGLHLVPTQIGTTQNSSVDISALTTATGEIHWSLTPVWTIPPNPYGVTSGPGPTTEGTITCHEEPTTTSSTSTSVASTTSSTTSPASTTTLPPAPPSSISGRSATPSTRIGHAIVARSPELPMTGSSHTNAELFGGAGLLALGLTLAKRWKR